MSAPAAAPSTQKNSGNAPDVVQSVGSFIPGRPDRQSRAFECGDVVCITHLKTRKDLNWRLGKVVVAPEDEESRVGVRLLADTDASSTPHGLKPINIFTIPRNITAKELANLVHASTFGEHQCVSVEDAKLLIKEFDFKYTPPWEKDPSDSEEERGKAAPAGAGAERTVTWQYPDNTVRTMEYTDDMTEAELVQKVYKEVTMHADAVSGGGAPATAPKVSTKYENAARVLHQKVREKTPPPPPPPPSAAEGKTTTEPDSMERARAVVAANRHAEVNNGSGPNWDDEQKALALASFAAITGVPVEQAISEAHRRYGS